MNTITQQQRDEFYQGFVAAMLWSTGGEADYCDAPEGYEIEQANSAAEVDSDGEVWHWMAHDGDASERIFASERAAVIDAWEDSGEEPPTLESLEDFELAPATAASLRAHCDAWIDAFTKLLVQYSEERYYDSGQGTVWHYAGHDFWLTSAGHGTGFWDRGLGGLGDALTAACEQFAHKHHAYIGDDGLIYVSGMEEPRQTVNLTAQQYDDAIALIQRGADDARQAARLPDYTDAEAAELERLAAVADGIISAFQGAAS